MRTLTITEALAELKTLEKRIEKKREFVNSYLFRQEMLKDPLLTQGGSTAALLSERQSIRDLEGNVVTIRTAIQRINLDTIFDVCGTTNSITGWLVWRRDVAPKQQEHLRRMRQILDQARSQAQKQGYAVTQNAADAKPQDVVVNLDEKALAQDIEMLETVLGTLDGQLSLKNATVTISIPD